MLKFLFNPHYSIFECLVILYAVIIMSNYSFWLGILLLPVGVIIQVIMTNKIHKQELNQHE
jgi:hypothetical protein